LFSGTLQTMRVIKRAKGKRLWNCIDRSGDWHRAKAAPPSTHHDHDYIDDTNIGHRRIRRHAQESTGRARYEEVAERRSRETAGDDGGGVRWKKTCSNWQLTGTDAAHIPRRVVTPGSAPHRVRPDEPNRPARARPRSPVIPRCDQRRSISTSWADTRRAPPTDGRTDITACGPTADRVDGGRYGSGASSDIVHQYNVGRLRTSTSICRRRRHCLFGSADRATGIGSMRLVRCMAVCTTRPKASTPVSRTACCRHS